MIAVKEAESLFADAKLDVLRGTLSHGAKKIIITTHHKPDADALGSSLGLAGYLQKLEHDVRVITPTDFPSFLDWMQGRSYVLQFDQNDKTKAEAAKLVAEADVIFCLDFNTLERINDLGKLVGQSTARKVMIDHHMQPADFADLIFSDIHAAATAELVYLLIDALGHRELIDKGVAECLYAGIMTDTGSFRHGSTTARIHRVIADLIELGADNSRVHTLIYDNSSLNRLQFLGYCLSEKLVYLPEFKTAYFAITKEELMRYHILTGDTEGVVNYALSLQGVVLGAIIIDRTEMVKMSFRSAADFDVNTFARRYFEGGGHYNAAGGKSLDSLEVTVERFLSALREHASELAVLNKG
jgi:phosphoesterase RecJ-like protein